MRITFTGVGTAFADESQWQTNAVVEASNGKRLLIDFGHYGMLALKEALNITPMNITDELDGLYITHLHGDHVGAVDLLGLATYFIGGARQDPSKRLKLFAAQPVMDILWERALQGKMQTVEGKLVDLTDYFDCIPVPENGCFYWQNLRFQPVQLLHIISGRYIPPCFGLLFDERSGHVESPKALPPRRRGTSVFRKGDDVTNARRIGPRVLYSIDTQFNPPQLQAFYDQADVIFHDCETAPFHSTVHAHYEDLRTLSDETRAKMWLVHYQKDGPQKYDAQKDGFKGFVTKGQTFDFPADPELVAKVEERQL
jgi:ribonuclease BN (tRNA processing enzyme)